MGAKNYIVALELGSSKMSGTIGLKTYDGLQIMAYATEPVEGFISKGVVQNIDKTSGCINNIINKLESNVEGITIEKAYVALGGLSIHSLSSCIVREFNEYTKITREIVEEMITENDELFIAPEGYQKVQVITLEYFLNGDKGKEPIGMSTKRIEGHYLNIIVKEQLMKQLQESFNQANIEIADSFTAALLTANLLLENDEKRQGCALIDIGAETTTVAVYINDLLRRLSVLPLGGALLTKDLCAEGLSPEEAEQEKCHRRDHAEASTGSHSLKREKIEEIIAARMTEILANVREQIARSGENIQRCVLTGGGSKLKNIDLFLEEQLPSFKYRIASENRVEFNTGNNLRLATEEMSTTLLGLLEEGEGNCCQQEEEEKEEEKKRETESSFTSPQEELPTDNQPIETAQEESKKNRQNFDLFGQVVEEKKGRKKNTNKKLLSHIGGLFDNLVGGMKDFVDKATNDEDEN